MKITPSIARSLVLALSLLFSVNGYSQGTPPKPDRAGPSPVFTVQLVKLKAFCAADKADPVELKQILGPAVAIIRPKLKKDLRVVSKYNSLSADVVSAVFVMKLLIETYDNPRLSPHEIIEFCTFLTGGLKALPGVQNTCTTEQERAKLTLHYPTKTVTCKNGATPRVNASFDNEALDVWCGGAIQEQIRFAPKERMQCRVIKGAIVTVWYTVDP